MFYGQKARSVGAQRRLDALPADVRAAYDVPADLDWPAIIANIESAIADGYGDASDIAASAISDYGLTVDDAMQARIVKAVDALYERSTGYVRMSLVPYLKDLEGDGAEEAASARLEMYAEPTWTVFQQVKGEAFASHGMQLEWNLDPASDHCADCPEIAANSPYDAPDSGGSNPLPTWPGDGDTICMVKCNCEVTPTEDSWNEFTDSMDAERQDDYDAEAASLGTTPGQTVNGNEAG